ncbi:MAG: hypothetical protein ACI4AM_03535, partial [Muribaculaceae bacterium]
MKTIIKLALCATLAVVAAACSSTDAPTATADQVINLDATQVVATLNDAAVQPTAASLNLADHTLTLAGVLPGEDLVINVTTTDTPEGITFEGRSACTPSINPEANRLADIFVNVRGTIINGIANIIVRTGAAIEQNRAMVGEWSLLNKITYSGPIWNRTIESSPLMLTWDAAPNVELMISQIGAAMVYQNFKSLKLNDDATAQFTYCPDMSMSMTMPGADGTIPEPTHNNWVTTDRNQFFWYVRNDRLCIVPNVYKMLTDRLATINAGQPFRSRAIDRDQIDSIQAQVVESIQWVREFAKQWAAPGLTFKYTLDGD